MQPTLPGVEETVVETRQGSDLAADPPSIESASDRSCAETDHDRPPAVVAETRRRSATTRRCACSAASQMQRAGSCHACPSCGTTSGCS